MLKAVLMFVAVAFVVYAVVEYYRTTPTTDSVAKRVWLSLLAGAAAFAAFIVSLFHSGTTTP